MPIPPCSAATRQSRDRLRRLSSIHGGVPLPTILAFIQHDDLFGILDGGDALGDDQHSAVAGLLLERLAQGGVGLEIQRREAVIKDIDRRLS